jgi:thioredoxin 1
MSVSLFNKLESREEFDSIINENNVCVVDFFGVWCTPCKTLAHSLESIARTNSNFQKAYFLKVDVDQFNDLAEIYNVSALPYLIFFKNGKLTEHNVTGDNSQQVVKIVAELVNS